MHSKRTTRVERVCPQCGQTVFKKPCQLRARNFCSFGCRVLWQHAQAGRPCIIEGNRARVPLHRHDGSVKAYAVIDAADAEWASQWKWCQPGRYAERRQYLDGGQSIRIYLHRALLGLAPDDVRRGDHINRNQLDNRRTNLRAVPIEGNAQNKSSWRGSSSKYRGVSLKKRTGQWVARITVNRQTIQLGTFDNEDEAGAIARAARLRYMPFAVD